jgi:hypothetical protein
VRPDRLPHFQVDLPASSSGSIVGRSTYVDGILLDAHARVRPGERVAVGPVGGGTAPVEQSGRGEHESAGAYRRHPSRARSRARDEAQEGGVARRAPRSFSACDRPYPPGYFSAAFLLGSSAGFT